MLDCRCYGRSTYHKQSVVLLYISSNLLYRIAGNFRWVQIFTIFADRPASANIRTTKKCTKMEIDDVITCVRRYELNLVNEMVLCVCPLNGCCKEESACYHTKYQQIRKRHSKVVKVEISSTESNMLVYFSGHFSIFSARLSTIAAVVNNLPLD